jgi:hypothetical protein
MTCWSTCKILLTRKIQKARCIVEWSGPFLIDPCLALIDLVELVKQIRIFRNSLVVLSSEPNRPLFVDDEDRALWHSLGPETIILSADCAMGPEIR